MSSCLQEIPEKGEYCFLGKRLGRSGCREEFNQKGFDQCWQSTNEALS